jgi:hypothetical protein
VGAFTPASFRFQWERREETVEVMVLTGGSHLSARGSERAGYRFGCGRCWAAGLIGSWADSFPRGPFSIFISFASFLFLFSLLLSNTFQIESKQGQINF